MSDELLIPVVYHQVNTTRTVRNAIGLLPVPRGTWTALALVVVVMAKHRLEQTELPDDEEDDNGQSEEDRPANRP